MASSSSFEEYVAKVCEPGPEQALPGVVLIAADASGEATYVKTAGSYPVDSAHVSPLTTGSTFWLASCTKLLTAVAVMQCVERGLVTLDDDVRSILTEWQDTQVLTGFDEKTGEPELTSLQGAAAVITLRHLLTHTAGMGYDFWSPLIAKWWAWRQASGKGGRRMKGEIVKDYIHPLLYEPGEGWEYSVAIDWAGQLVERLTGLRLGVYMKKNIWDVLGMHSTAFRLTDDKAVEEKLVSTTTRNGQSGKLEASGIMGGIRDPNPVDDLGGGGLFSSPDDFMKVLISLLQNDGKLLKPETVEMMRQPQLKPGSAAHKALISYLSSPEGGLMLRGGVPYASADDAKPEEGWNFSLMGLLSTKPVEGLCEAGTVRWGGLPNLFWWIDPKGSAGKGNCGFLAMQLLPAGDPKALEFVEVWMRELYKQGKAGK